MIIAIGECGYGFDLADNGLNAIERELTELFVDEGLFGEIPKSLQF